MEDFEGARGVPRVPRRPPHGPPVYQAPMYGGFDGRMANQFPPPPPQGPGGHPQHGQHMMQPPYHQPPMPHPQQQHPSFNQRNVREWDSQPPFDGDRQEFKRRRYQDSFHGPQGGNVAPHPMGQQPMGMYQQPPNPGVAPPYGPMGMPQHDMGPRHDMQTIPGHMPPMAQNSFPYPGQVPPQQPPSALGGPPQNALGLNESYHNLPPPPRREFPPARNDAPRNAQADPQGQGQAPSAQFEAKTGTAGSSAGSPGRSALTNPNEPMTFKDYLAKQPDSISPQSAQDGYTAYLQEFTRRQPNRFFDMHKEEEWFRERYDPKYVRDRVKRIEVEVSDRAVEFRDIWEKGGSEVCAPYLSVGGPQDGVRDVPKDKSQRASSEKVIEIVEDRKGDADAVEVLGDPEGAEKPGSSAVQVDDAKVAIASVDLQGQSTSDDEKKAEAVSKSSEEVKRSEDDANGASKGSETKEMAAKEDGMKTESKIEAKMEADGDEARATTGEDAQGVVKKEERKALATIVPIDDEKKSKERTSSGEEIETKVIEAKVEQPSEGNIPSKLDAKEEGRKTDQTDASKSSPTVTPGDKTVEFDKKKKQSRRKDGLCLPLRRQHQKDTIFMRGIPRNLSRAALVKTLRGGTDGTANLTLRRLKLGDINPVRGLQRFGWAVYDTEETAKRAMEIVRGAVVKSSDVPKDEKNKGKEPVFAEAKKKRDDDPESVYTIDCMLNMERRRKFTEGRTLPAAFADPTRVKRDADQAVQIMRHLDSLRKIDPALNPITDELLTSLPSDESRLDHAISYLREVHYFCYYSGNEFLEDPTSMPPQEMRPKYSPQRVASQSEADARMVRRVDERTKWVLDRDYDRPRSNGDNGEAARAEHLKAWLDANTSDEGNGRFRCRLPPHKLFKGPAFVHKHIRTKHPAAVQEILEKADLETYRSNFENDASKAEVISIFNQGISRVAAEESENAGGIQGGVPGAAGMAMMGNVGASYPQVGANMGMYRAPFMGMGVQFPMMMVPQAGATGFAPAYGPGAPFQAGNMGFAGQGIGMPGMMPMQSNGGYRGRGGRANGREGGRRGGRNWGRGGASPYGNGRHPDDARDRDGPRRGSDRPLPVDPRAKGRRYNDLDAPSDGPGIDLVNYEDI